MTIDQLQERCELGQAELMRTNYLLSERILAEAEQLAWEQRDFDTLARLYMPLQEARRQRRQRCGEGEVCLDLWAENEFDRIDGAQAIENYPFGQLLIAGWGSIEPAIQARRLAHQLELYVEVFLGAVYPTTEGKVVAVVPLESADLPDPTPRSLPGLVKLLPSHALILQPGDMPMGPQRGDANTFARVTAMWERLHTPFLAAADAEQDPVRKIEKYRATIQVDYACELAHQRLADVARMHLGCERQRA